MRRAHEATLDEELHELDIDPLGTDIDDAFDASFDTTSADEGVPFDAEAAGAHLGGPYHGVTVQPRQLRCACLQIRAQVELGNQC